jgi:predicted transcriptional regulator
VIRRSKLEVLLDILRVVREEGQIRRTRLMYRANLAWKVLRESLQLLAKNDLIRVEEDGDVSYIVLTPKGHALMQKFDEVESVFAPMINDGQSRAETVLNPPLRPVYRPPTSTS